MKLSKEQKRILKEDIETLEWLAKKFKAEGKLTKSADCESEKARLEKRLRGEENGISIA